VGVRVRIIRPMVRRPTRVMAITIGASIGPGATW
jgi:hypothetical protein